MNVFRTVLDFRVDRKVAHHRTELSYAMSDKRYMRRKSLRYVKRLFNRAIRRAANLHCGRVVHRGAAPAEKEIINEQR